MALYPSLIQSALLFDQKQPVDLDGLVKAFLAGQAISGIEYNFVFDTVPGKFYRLFGTNNLMITIEYIDSPAQADVFEPSLSSPFTPVLTHDAAQRLARHKSHILVGVHHGSLPPIAEVEAIFKTLTLARPGHSLAEFKERLTMCAHVSGMVNRAAEAVLVHWTTSNLLLTGELFSGLAEMSVPNPLHIHPLPYAAGTSADGRDQIEFNTFGVQHFLDREIHVLPTPLPWQEVLNGIYAFVAMATAKNGYIIPDGDTFSPEGEEFTFRVRYINAGEKSGKYEGPLFQLELLNSKAHNITSPEFVQPVRTFTDQNIPGDIVAGLGSKGNAVAQEWRAKRQMAEAAGATFQVKTDKPAPKKGGLFGWLPFGKKN